MSTEETNPTPDTVVETPPETPSGNKKGARDLVKPTIEKAARVYGVDPKLMEGIVFGGEGGNPDTSSAGAKGWGQMLPSTFKDMGGKNIDDPEENILMSAKYMKTLIDHFGGDTEKAIAAYNAGPGRVDSIIGQYGDQWRSHLPKETQKYVPNTLAHMIDNGATDLSATIPISPTQTFAQENKETPDLLQIVDEPKGTLIPKYRQQFAQYNQFDDESVIQAEHQAQAPDMDYNEFRKQFLMEFGNDETKSSVFDEFGKSWMRRIHEVASGVASVLNMFGDNDKFAPGYFKRKIAENAPAPDIAKSVLDDPSQLTSFRWWASQLGGLGVDVPLMAASAGIGGAIAGGVAEGIDATATAIKLAEMGGSGLAPALGMSIENSGHIYQEARDAGKTHDEAAQLAEENFAISAPVNAMMMAIPAGKAFAAMRNEGQLVTENMMKKAAGAIFKDIGESGISMAMLGTTQQIINNISLDRPYNEGLGESAVMGGIMGTVFGIGTESMGALRRAGARSLDAKMKGDYIDARSAILKGDVNAMPKQLESGIGTRTETKSWTPEELKETRMNQINSWDDNTVKEELRAMKNEMTDFMPKEFVDNLNEWENTLRTTGIDGKTPLDDRGVLREFTDVYSDIYDAAKVERINRDIINNARPKDTVGVAEAFSAPKGVPEDIKKGEFGKPIQQFYDAFQRMPNKAEMKMIAEGKTEDLIKKTDVAGGKSLAKALSVYSPDERDALNTIFGKAAEVAGVTPERYMARHFVDVTVDKLIRETSVKKYLQSDVGATKDMIEKAGMIPVGSQDTHLGKMVLFNHPKTGSTLAMFEHEMTPESIAKHVKEHEAKFPMLTQDERGEVQFKRGMQTREARGAVEPLENGARILHLFTKPMAERTWKGPLKWSPSDSSTFLHEMAHAGIHLLDDAQRAIVENHFGRAIDDFSEDNHETYARMFEQYFWEGKAPTKELGGVFQKLKEMFSKIYSGVKNIIDLGNLHAELSVPDDIRQVFDSMFDADLKRQLGEKFKFQDDFLKDYEEQPLGGTKRVGFLRDVNPDELDAVQERLRSHGYEAVPLPTIKDEEGRYKYEVAYGMKNDKDFHTAIKYRMAENSNSITPTQIGKLRALQGYSLDEIATIKQAWQEKAQKEMKARNNQAYREKQGITPRKPVEGTTGTGGPSVSEEPMEVYHTDEGGDNFDQALSTEQDVAKVRGDAGQVAEIGRIFGYEPSETGGGNSGFSIRRVSNDVKETKMMAVRSNKIIRDVITKLKATGKARDLGMANVLDHWKDKDEFKVSQRNTVDRIWKEDGEKPSDFEVKQEDMKQFADSVSQFSDWMQELKDTADPVMREELGKLYKDATEFLFDPENQDALNILRSDPDYGSLDLDPPMEAEERANAYDVLGLRPEQGDKLSDYDIADMLREGDKQLYFQAEMANPEPEKTYELGKILTDYEMDSPVKLMIDRMAKLPSQLSDYKTRAYRLLATPQTLAGMDKVGFGRLFKFENKLVEMKNNIMTRILENPAYLMFKKADRDHQARVFKLLIDGTTYGVNKKDMMTVATTPPWMKDDWIPDKSTDDLVKAGKMAPEDAQKIKDRQDKAREDYLRNRSEATNRIRSVGKIWTAEEASRMGYSPKEYEDYQTIRGFMDGNGDQEGLVSLWKKASIMNGLDPSTANIIYGLTGYFPLDRSNGKFSLRYSDPSSPTGYSFTRFKTEAEGNAARKSLIGKGLIDPNDSSAEVMQVRDALQRFGHTFTDYELHNLLEEVGDISTLRELMKSPDVDPESKAKMSNITDFADALMKEWKSRNYATARTIPRGNVGIIVHPESLIDAFETFVGKTASRYSGAMGHSQLTGMMAEMGGDIRPGESNADYARRGAWAKYAYQRLSDTTRYADPLESQAWNKLRGAGFLWALGGNISNGIVNATQTLMTLLPEMHAWRANQVANTRTWLWAEKEAAKMAFGGRISDAMAKAYPEMQAMLDELKLKGKLNASLVDETFVAKSVPDKLRWWATQPQARSETKNRISSVLSGYMMAQDHLIDAAKGNRKLAEELASIAHISDDKLEQLALNIPGGVKRMEATKAILSELTDSLFNGTVSKEERQRVATEFAGHISDKTQFVYGPHNLPKFITSAGIFANPLKAGYLFKGFTNNYVGWFINSMRADPDKSFWQNTAHQAVVVAPLLAMAGASGLPFADDIKDVLKALGVVDTDTQVRKMIGNDQYSDVVLKGLPGLMPKDIAPNFEQRIGVGQVAPSGLASGDVGQALVNLFGGAPLSMIDNFTLESFKDYKAGNYTGAYQRMLPVFASNLVKATTLAEHGVETRPGHKLVGAEEVNPIAVAEQAIGVPTMQTADARDFNEAMKYIATSKQNIVNGFNERLARAIAEGTSADVQDVVNDIVHFDSNSRNQVPERYYNFKQELPALRKRVEEMMSDVGVLANTPKPLQPAYMKTRPTYMGNE